MKEKTIKVLKVEPKKLPEVCELENELEALQKAIYTFWRVRSYSRGTLWQLTNILQKQTALLCPVYSS